MFSHLLKKILTTEENFLSVEVIPTNSGNNHSIFSKIDDSLVIDYIDAFIVTDSPFGKMKSSPFFMSLGLQCKYNKPSICTLSLRDRNKIALQSDILGSNEFNLQAFLALTGDKCTEKSTKVKNVFEGNSLLLLEMIESFNNKKDFFGNDFKEDINQIYPFAVSNSYAKDYKRLEKKIKDKVDRGAIAIFTQPVFCDECIDKLLEIRDNIRNSYEKSDKRRDFEIIFGFFPIMKPGTLNFIDKNLKGLDISDKYKEMFNKLDHSNYEEMVEFNKMLFNKFYQKHPKFHIMALNNFNLIKEIML